MRQENRPGDEAMESLYPFLYSDTSDLPAVLGQVRASTLAKVEEILELRRVGGGRGGGAWCALSPFLSSAPPAFRGVLGRVRPPPLARVEETLERRRVVGAGD